MPCQKKMESRPATLKISEKPRKYHFLPRKSMLVFLNNSTDIFVPNWLDADCLSYLLAVQIGVEDHARYKDRSEDVGQKTKGQRDGKAPHWPGAEEEKNKSGNDGGYVGV